jgi:hypothetical protein
MDDEAFLSLLQIGIILAALLIIAAIIIVAWKTTCPQTTTVCDCAGDYPVQCNYQCYHASECTCNDLDDLKSVRDNLKGWVGKQSAGAGGAGSGTPTMQPGGKIDWLEGGKAAGITDGGEIWIDKSIMDNHCQYVADSFVIHETIHLGDEGCRNPVALLWQTVRQLFNSNYISELQDESEFSAYNAQIQFLNDKIAGLESTCSYEYRCSYSDEVFKDVQDCIAACPCSLKHPCAMVMPHCIEIDTKTGKETGMRY